MGDLEKWFLAHKRDFPWREKKDPYRVWISEVMLQQTRASVVVPYFERWMRLFPDVKALYKASVDEVIKAWEGLGYYSRARSIHRAAQDIVQRFAGIIPASYEELLSLPGFGPYTAGAVLSFGFHKRAVAVDGNVTRVTARYHGIEERIDRPHVKRLIHERVEALLDTEKPWVTAEALIELGASICAPKPRCADCPLRENCRAYSKGNAEALPIKKIEPAPTSLFRIVCIVQHEDHVLVRKCQEGEIMAGLYEFPYVEVPNLSLPQSTIASLAKKFLKTPLAWQRKHPSLSHAFTRYKAHLLPCVFSIKEKTEISPFTWVAIQDLPRYPFSSGHRKVCFSLFSTKEFCKVIL